MEVLEGDFEVIASFRARDDALAREAHDGRLRTTRSNWSQEMKDLIPDSKWNLPSAWLDDAGSRRRIWRGGSRLSIKTLANAQGKDEA